jgi:predicted dehydrogenase
MNTVPMQQDLYLTQAPSVQLAFIGTGWIGRARMESVLEKGRVKAVAIVDPSDEQAAAACTSAPGARRCVSLEEALGLLPVGVVIATPSAQHASQAQRALDNGCAVFCQKPLARSAAETERVIDVARRNNRLLGVDLSYRHLEGATILRDAVRSGELGRIFSVDCVFHNAYGPDKAWFYDRTSSGGGCLIDLGIHMIDLVLWLFDFPQVHDIRGALYCGGERPERSDTHAVEDFSEVRFGINDSSTIVRMACSWKLHAGCDAVIGVTLYGTRCGMSLHNCNGSFYEFATDRYNGTCRQTIHHENGGWGGRAIQDWAEKIAITPAYDPSIEHLGDVARIIDKIYEQ